MRKSYMTDQAMVISIPVESKDGAWPQQFHCLFKDAFKVFVFHGRPKALGAAQVSIAVFLLILSLFFFAHLHLIYVFPAVLYVVTGVFTLASSQAPNMAVTRLSLLLNLVSILSSVAAFCLGVTVLKGDTEFKDSEMNALQRASQALIWGLLVLEDLIALFLTYWISRAVCKQHFNVLPVILLKRGD